MNPLAPILASLGLSADFGPAMMLLGFFVILFLLYNSMVVVGGTQIAVLERRWLGAAMPEGRVVAMANQVGIQARILGPGLHLLTPFLYSVEKQPMVPIGEDEVGIIEAIDGAPVPPGRIFAKVTEGHN